MTATPQRAGFIRQKFRTVKAGPDAGVIAKYGAASRKSLQTIPTNFESQADTQIMANSLLALQSRDRRRFSQVVQSVKTIDQLNYTSGANPSVTVLDDDRGANHPAIVTEIGLNFENDTMSLENWG